MVEQLIQDKDVHALLVVAHELTKDAHKKWKQEKIVSEQRIFANRPAEETLLPASARIVQEKPSSPFPEFSGVLSIAELKQRVIEDYHFSEEQLNATLQRAPTSLLERQTDGNVVLTHDAEEMLESEIAQFVGGMTSRTKDGLVFTDAGSAALQVFVGLLGNIGQLAPETRAALNELVAAADASLIVGAHTSRTRGHSSQRPFLDL